MIYGGHFEPDKKEIRIKELETITSDPNFWNDKKNSESVIQELNELKNIDKTVENMLKSSKKYEKKINDLRNEYVYNLGNSGEVGADYIIECIQNKVDERSKK